MVRRSRLIAQLALVGVLSLLAFPASGSALRVATVIALTSTGPSPAVVTIPAGLYPVWANQDSVAHTVAFADGSCSMEIPPGSGLVGCPTGFASSVGSHPYTVDGTTQASVVVAPEARSVTLTAKRHSIRRGARLRLHGELTIPILSPPTPPAPQPVIVYAREHRHAAYRRIKVVIARTHGWKLRWHLNVRPGRQKTYIVEANSQPRGGQYWKQARSSAFTVRVGRS